MLSQAKPGDLVFFGKSNSKSDFEQAIIEVVPGDMVHVAMVKDANTLIHATTNDSGGGVLESSLEEIIADVEPHFVELCRVKLPQNVKEKAVEMAQSVVGAAYNDLFSPECVNSKGEKAYYCSQLVTEAYGGEDMQFPEHKMQFGTGDTLKYWENYYKERGRCVPNGEEGSHPSQLRKSPKLEQVVVQHCKKQ